MRYICVRIRAVFYLAYCNLVLQMTVPLPLPRTSLQSKEMDLIVGRWGEELVYQFLLTHTERSKTYNGSTWQVNWVNKEYNTSLPYDLHLRYVQWLTYVSRVPTIALSLTGTHLCTAHMLQCRSNSRSAITIIPAVTGTHDIHLQEVHAYDNAKLQLLPQLEHGCDGTYAGGLMGVNSLLRSRAVLQQRKLSLRCLTRKCRQPDNWEINIPCTESVVWATKSQVYFVSVTLYKSGLME